MWHFVRACDITTKQLIWVNVDNTFVGDAISIAHHGRVCK